MILTGSIGISPVAAQDRCAPNAQNEVADGCNLEAGTLALWEGAAWPSSWLYAGYIGDDGFTVNRASGYNAWAGFDNFEAALDGTCRTAEARMTSDGGGFTTVYVNDTPYSDRDACLALKAFGNAPSGSDSDQENAPANTDEESSEGNNAQEEDADLLTNSSLGQTDTDENGSSQTEEFETGTIVPAGVYEEGDGILNGIECRPALHTVEPGDRNQSDAPVSSESSIYEEEISSEPPDTSGMVGSVDNVESGECINAGYVLYRYVNHDEGYEDIRPLNINGIAIVAGTVELEAHDMWEGYGSERAVLDAACNQARSDAASARIVDENDDGQITPDEEDWNDGYRVLFNGKPVPQVCK